MRLSKLVQDVLLKKEKHQPANNNNKDNYRNKRTTKTLIDHLLQID